MQLFDMHCDTLYKAANNNSSLYDDSYHISLNKADFADRWIQFFAIWIPDDISKSRAKHLFDKSVEIFNRDKKSELDVSMYLTVENSAILNGDMKNFHMLTDNNVKALTITWNSDNEAGCGIRTLNDTGITAFGRQLVECMEHYNIAVDVSHASDKLFYDIERCSKKPFIATHSNSRSVCSDKRNLTDDQFKIIRDRHGLVGLNFYKCFLNDNGEEATSDDLLRHAEHFLNLGGEDIISIGSDFDGADMPGDISGIDSMPTIYAKFQNEFGKAISDKIFFDNAQRFFNL